MLTRFAKFIANNPLVSAIVGTFIGTVLATQYIAWKAPDLSGVARAVGGWLAGPAGSTRVDEIAIVLLSILLGIIFTVVSYVRAYPEIHRRKQQAAEEAVSKADAKAPVKIDRNILDMSPALRRALLVLRQRVDARTTLHDLHTLVTDDGTHTDRQTTKAQLQADMEDAERSGIVSIDRAGTLTQYYNLAIPEGRDWVLSNANELQKGAAEGMIKRDPRLRYR